MKNKELLQNVHNIARNAGFEVYVVGGYVRDYLLGSPGKDIDFVVVGDAMAFADQIKKEWRLRKVVRYPRFGTFMIRYYGFNMEFVQARAEFYSEHSRKPRTRPADLYTDLSRRDFTINTLAMDISGEGYGRIIDAYDGRKDLKNGIIRTPLQPLQTFSDDPLRMMRAVRFAARLRFNIEHETYEAIKQASDRLQIISQERITEEFNKIVLAEKPSQGIQMLEETGLLQQFLPELPELKGVEQRNQFHHKDVFYHTLEVVDNIAPFTDRLELRLAALFHDVGKPPTKRFDQNQGWTFHGHEVVGERMVGHIMQRMRYSGESIAYVKKMTRLHLRPMALVDDEVTDSAIRRVMFTAGDDIDDLMQLCRADITSKNPKRVKRYLNNYESVIEKMKEVEERDRLRNFQPPVDGNEIMQMFGLKPGPAVGRIKKFIEEAILNGDVPNDHDACVSYIKQNKKALVSENKDVESRSGK